MAAYVLDAISFTPTAYAVDVVGQSAAQSLQNVVINDFINIENLAFNSISDCIVAINWAAGFEASLNAFSPDWLGTQFGVTATSVTDPTVPISDYSGDVQTAFQFAINEIPNLFQSVITNFLTSFFPYIDTAVATTSDSWLSTTISTGSPVPASVENALWNRARDREAVDAARLANNAYESFAARGFSMPPGAVAAILASVQQEAVKKNASISRDIAIKDFDVSIDVTKFAVGQAVSLRSSFVQAMGEFIRVLLAHTGYATDYAKTILAAKTNMFDSAMKLYMGQIENQRMLIAADIGAADADIRYKDYTFRGKVHQYDTGLDIAKLQANTAVEASKTMVQVAGSAMSTRNTMLTATAAP